ncbi:hypothetical protein CcaCcLH18_11976 [Colletotrichum camelliae]|nr:hypothetical protein CcaCcLH18_11976 [Colletotrichum camelliae]
MKAPAPLFVDEQPMSTQTADKLADQVEGEAQYDRKQSLTRESSLDQSTVSLPHIPAAFGSLSRNTSINTPQIVETLSESISKDVSEGLSLLAYNNSPDTLHYLAYEAVFGSLRDDAFSHQQRCPLPVTKNALTWRIYETLSEHLEDYMGYDHEWARPFLVKGQSYSIRVYHLGCFVESPPADLLQRKLVASQLYDELDSARCEFDFSELEHDIFNPYFYSPTWSQSQVVVSSGKASTSTVGAHVSGIITGRAFARAASTTSPFKNYRAEFDEIECRSGLRPNLDDYKKCLNDFLLKRDKENSVQHNQNDNSTKLWLASPTRDGLSVSI